MNPRILLALFLTTLSCATADLKKDVEYGVAGGERLLLDVNVPAEPGLHPIAILVHGGGWSSGDKSGSNKPGDGADISPWFGPLTEAHYTWFSINYRLAPKNRWPACIDDLKTAVRWVKAHAAEYKGDARRVALFGHSAGGQLVCLAGTQFADEIKVQAIVGFAPVTEFEQELPTRGGLSSSLQNLFERPKELTPDSLALLRKTSPLTYVKTGLPPFLILHGDKDKSVLFQQTLNFVEKLHSAGVSCDLITIPGAPHSLLAWDKFYPDYKAQLIDWLNRTLDTALAPAKVTAITSGRASADPFLFQ